MRRWPFAVSLIALGCGGAPGAKTVELSRDDAAFWSATSSLCAEPRYNGEEAHHRERFNTFGRIPTPALQKVLSDAWPALTKCAHSLRARIVVRKNGVARVTRVDVAGDASAERCVAAALEKVPFPEPEDEEVALLYRLDVCP